MDGFLRNVYKNDSIGKNFKYYVMDSSYYKDNAGKKEMVLDYTPKSVFFYELKGYTDREIEIEGEGFKTV